MSNKLKILINIGIYKMTILSVVSILMFGCASKNIMCGRSSLCKCYAGGNLYENENLMECQILTPTALNGFIFGSNEFLLFYDSGELLGAFDPLGNLDAFKHFKEYKIDEVGFLKNGNLAWVHDNKRGGVNYACIENDYIVKCDDNRSNALSLYHQVRGR